MRLLSALALLACCSLSVAQPPPRPLQPLDTWSLPGYHAIASEPVFHFAAGMKFASPSSASVTRDNHLLVFDRGDIPFYEFTTDGNLVRTFGDRSLFERAHGLRIAKNGDLWVTDIGNHVVRKLDKDGKLLLTIGTVGKAGEWDESKGLRQFNEPNETAVDSKGNVYVAQGHGKGEPRVLKFGPDGKFIKQWGTRGTGPGQFQVAHSIEIDANDRLYVADRENQRIEQFDTDGNYLSEWKYTALVCALYFHTDGTLYMTSGFDGEWGKLDKDGKLVGSLGSPGKGVGQFGEAHYLTVDHDGNVYIADVVNRRVQIYHRD